MSHQISDRRFTTTCFRKSGPERVTQVMPMQIVDSSQLTSRRERFLNVFIRLDGIRIEEDVSVGTNSAAYLPQRISHVFVHRNRVVSSSLRVRHVDQSTLEVDLLPGEVEQISSPHTRADRENDERQQVSTRTCQH